MPKGYYIDHYDKDLKLLKEHELEIEKNEIKGIIIENGILSLLQSELDKKANKFRLNVLQSPLSKFDFKKTTLLSFDEDDVKKYFGGFIWSLLYK